MRLPNIAEGDRPQHRRLVAGTRPATTLPPVAYISTDFIGCAVITVFCALLFAIGILSHHDSYAIAVRYLCYRDSIPMLSRCDTYVIATP